MRTLLGLPKGVTGQTSVRRALRRTPNAEIRAIVLHQTTGRTFLNERNQRCLAATGPAPISAHFVILQNGMIYYTHDVVDYRSGSAGRGQGIDIEFAGNFPHFRSAPSGAPRVA